MASSISFSAITKTYSGRERWGGACKITLSDGTRLVATACGTGFKVYGNRPENSRFVAFLKPVAIDWSKEYPLG